MFRIYTDCSQHLQNEWVIPVQMISALDATLKKSNPFFTKEETPIFSRRLTHYAKLIRF